MHVVIYRSKKAGKKYTAEIHDGDHIVHIHFGDPKGKQYPIHKDKTIKAAYVARHEKTENWTRSGVRTAGFWSKHILWNETTIAGSIARTEKFLGFPVRRK